MNLLEIYDHLSDIIILLDAENQILALNIRAKKYFGKSVAIGQDYFIACQTSHVEAIANLAESHASTQFAHHRFINWKIIPDGQNKLLIGQETTTIPELQTYLFSLLNVAYPGLHVYWFSKDHRLLLCNQSQATILGKQNISELINKPLWEIAALMDPDLEAAQKVYETVKANNLQVMTDKKPLLFEEIICSSPERSFLSYKAPFYDDAGEVQGILGISTETTEMRNLQKQLEKSQHATDIYLESILASSPSNIYWMDQEGRIIGCNDQEAKWVGFNSRHDVIGLTIFDIAKRLGWDPALAKAIREHDLTVMKDGKPAIDREYTTVSGEEKIFLTSKSPMFDNQGEVIGILGISTEITSQIQIEKKLEQAKEAAEKANRYKSEFIANISHDIRTPLLGISGMTALLAEQLPAEFQADMRAIVNASNELMQLLNSVINLVKVEMDDIQKSRLESFNLKEMIESLIDLFTPIAQQKKLLLRVYYPENIPLYFSSATYIIRQIILNLLSNAIKFTHTGTVTLTVSQDHHATVLDNKIFPLLVTVEDTGIGIAEQHYAEIFESFHRLHPAYQNKYPGSGLGLAIVKQSATQLGGKVWVSSEVDKGSCFYLSLPLPLSDQNSVPTKHIPVKQTPKIKPPPTSNRRVLLVEDNVLIQKITSALLNKLGLTVDTARTAMSSIELAKQNHYDLIFMDIGLPDKDGVWTAQEIRKLAHHLHTPIIALTAHLDPSYRDTCLSAGINDLITKPLTLDNAQAFLEKFGL